MKVNSLSSTITSRITSIITAAQTRAFILGGIVLLVACAPRVAAQNTRDSANSKSNAAATPAVAHGTTTQAKLKSLGGKKCKDSDFTCVTLSVPLNHDDPSSEQIKVMFAVWPASGTRKGMFVTAVGGPGGSGISETETRAKDLPKALHKNFDFVLFDPRGIGRSGYMDCGDAYNNYDTPPAETAAQEAEVLKSTQAFVKSCLREMKVGDGTKLRYYATKQVAEDLETFRSVMGEDKLWLLGESYGTQLAQTYAALHPARLAALVLDGPVDLQHPGFDFLDERSRNYEALFKATIQTCQSDKRCTTDSKQDLLRVYDDLIKTTDQKPLKIKFPDENGALISQQLTRQDIEGAFSDAIGSENGRMLAQRMLAAAARGNYVPLGRGAGLPASSDSSPANSSPDTGNPPGDSDAMYYVVDCADNAYFPGDADARAKAYLQAGNAIDTDIRFSRYAYQNVVCVYWPHAGEGHYAFDPTRLASVPTLIIGATGDSNTPAANAERIHQTISGSHLIMFEGGEHVMFSRGEKCIDDAVLTFLVAGQPPTDSVTACSGQFTEAYIPIAPENAKSYRDALEAMRSFEDQIFALPEYLGWEGDEALALGCDAGGTLNISLNKNGAGDTFEMQDCAFAKGFVFNGAGSFKTESGEVKFNGDVSGNRTGQLNYSHADGVMRVNGKLDGKMIKLKRDD